MRLEDYKNRQPFSTPDGYFEELNKRIIEATSKAPSVTPVPARKRITLGMYARWTSIAAMFALVCLIAAKSVFNSHTIKGASDTTVVESILASNLDNITDEEYFENLLENYTFDDYTFYCYLTEYE